MPRLDDDVLYVLAHNLEIDSVKRTIRINTRLEAGLYERVTAIFGGLGAKWVGKASNNTGRHKFPTDPAPQIEMILLTGEDNPRDFFATRDDVGEYMASCLNLASLPPNPTACEPGYGTGALVRGLLKQAVKAMRLDLSVHAVEVNAGLYRKAVATHTSAMYTFFHTDFLTWEAPQQYDVVIMNPPFGKRAEVNAQAEPDIYIRHILRAWCALKPGGRLVTIAPPGWTYRNESAKDANMPWIDRDTRLTPPQFRRFVEMYGTYVTTRGGLFSDSGTEIAVTIILLGLDSGKAPQMPALPAALAPEPPREKRKSEYEDLSLEELTREILRSEHAANIAMHSLMASLGEILVGGLGDERTTCVTCGQPVDPKTAFFDARKRLWHPICAQVYLGNIPHILEEASNLEPMEQAA